MVVCMKTRYFFCFLYFFCNISEKIRCFNTGFVSLQCKNANQYKAKLIEKYARKSKKFEKFFFWNFLFFYFIYNSIYCYYIIIIYK
jgi:hypothetical protein